MRQPLIMFLVWLKGFMKYQIVKTTCTSSANVAFNANKWWQQTTTNNERVNGCVKQTTITTTLIVETHCYTRRYSIRFYIIADIYFFSIRQHKTQNSFSFCWQSMVKEKEAFSKNKNKRATRKIRITAGRPQCINWLQDSFLKWITVP